MSLTHATSDPLLGRIALAKAINRMSGGTVIRPWDEETFAMLEITGWLDAFRAMQSDLPAIETGLKKVEAAKAAILAKHPTYRKH